MDAKRRRCLDAAILRFTAPASDTMNTDVPKQAAATAISLPDPSTAASDTMDTDVPKQAAATAISPPYPNTAASDTMDTDVPKQAAAAAISLPNLNTAASDTMETDVPERAAICKDIPVDDNIINLASSSDSEPEIGAQASSVTALAGSSGIAGPAAESWRGVILTCPICCSQWPASTMNNVEFNSHIDNCLRM
eukprot:gene28075-31180_t